MSSDNFSIHPEAEVRLDKLLEGRFLTDVRKSEHLWQFFFDAGEVLLNLECPWRIVVNGKVAYGDEDHGQKFGLLQSLDGTCITKEFLSGSKIVSARMADGTGDLYVVFENGSHLELFNSSCGYEGWTLSDKNGFSIIAMGGGDIAVFTGHHEQSQ